MCGTGILPFFLADLYCRDTGTRCIGEIVNRSRRETEGAEFAEEKQHVPIDVYPCSFRYIRVIRDKAVEPPTASLCGLCALYSSA